MNNRWADLPTIAIEVAGESWTVIGPAEVLADRKRLPRPLFMSCNTCKALCTDVGPCSCCQLGRRRQYDLKGSHGRLAEAEVLEAIVAQVGPTRRRIAS